MPDIVLLHPGSTFTYQQVQRSELRDYILGIDVYDLPAVDLGRFTGMIVDSGCDQEFLLKERDRIRAFVDEGKVVVFSGHLFRPWLPGAGMFTPKTIRSFRDYTVKIVQPRPIFDGVQDEDLTLRKGVAGFFARGHHEPPPGSEILVEIAGGVQVVYIDRVTTRGTMLVHSGNDLMASVDRDSTAGRIAGQLVRWIRDEAASLAARKVTA